MVVKNTNLKTLLFCNHELFSKAYNKIYTKYVRRNHVRLLHYYAAHSQQTRGVDPILY